MHKHLVHGIPDIPTLDCPTWRQLGPTTTELSPPCRGFEHRDSKLQGLLVHGTPDIPPRDFSIDNSPLGTLFFSISLNRCHASQEWMVQITPHVFETSDVVNFTTSETLISRVPIYRCLVSGSPKWMITWHVSSLRRMAQICVRVFKVDLPDLLSTGMSISRLSTPRSPPRVSTNERSRSFLSLCTLWTWKSTVHILPSCQSGDYCAPPWACALSSETWKNSNFPKASTFLFFLCELHNPDFAISKCMDFLSTCPPMMDGSDWFRDFHYENSRSHVIVTPDFTNVDILMATPLIRTFNLLFMRA